MIGKWGTIRRTEGWLETAELDGVELERGTILEVSNGDNIVTGIVETKTLKYEFGHDMPTHIDVYLKTEINGFDVRIELKDQRARILKMPEVTPYRENEITTASSYNPSLVSKKIKGIV